jgi:hypothetical protein
MQKQHPVIPYNQSYRAQTLSLQKVGLAIFACSFIFSYADITLAETKTDYKTIEDTTEATEKSKAPKIVNKIKDISNPENKTTETAEKKQTSKVTNNIKSKASKADTVELKDMVVETGRAKDLIGITGSASQGEISQAQFEYRPLSRNGELVEVVPGAVATQHSGSGKANQYFLRGFNLDHGTDFTTYVDGIPMNMPTHAHGQGYMDINSVIPELVKKIEYGKGPYYAEVGDFSAAGYAKMFSVDKLPEGILKFTGGSFDYYRTLIANSNKMAVAIYFTPASLISITASGNNRKILKNSTACCATPLIKETGACQLTAKAIRTVGPQPIKFRKPWLTMAHWDFMAPWILAMAARPTDTVSRPICGTKAIAGKMMPMSMRSILMWIYFLTSRATL